MKTFKQGFLFRAGLTVFASLTLSACGIFDDDDDTPLPPEPNFTYQVTITNLTSAQPLSPVAVALHDSGQPWSLGQSASLALEQLAEGGDNSFLLAESWVDVGGSGSDVLMPGGTETITVTKPSSAASLMSVVTMLVNTTDAITGLSAFDISGFAVNDSQTMTLAAYDAGTEMNSEVMGSIPGPADGGEGFNAARDDVDFVSRHPGVVSQQDGLSSSVLMGIHKFDNPVIRVTVTRTE